MSSEKDAPDDADAALPPRYSEEAQAAEWVRRHGDDWCFDAERGRWRFYEHGRWLEDLTLRAFDLARGVARDTAAVARADSELSESSRARIASAIASARNVSAILTLARADRKVAVSSEYWDRHPWLLNTARGVLDLGSGPVLRLEALLADARGPRVSARSRGGQPCPRLPRPAAETAPGAPRCCLIRQCRRLDRRRGMDTSTISSGYRGTRVYARAQTRARTWISG